MFDTFYTVFYLGPIPIQVWGLFVSLGMVLSFIILYYRSKKYSFDPNKMIDLGVWIMISGFVFARFFHVFFYETSYFLANPLDIFRIWQGGLSSFGGLFGGLLVVFIFIKQKKIKRENLLKIGDLFGFSAVYGWMVGRVGCMLIHDHLGTPCDCILSVQTKSGPRLDMAAMEILFLIPLAILFFVMRKKQKPKGWFLAILFIYYGILRLVLDFWRATDIIGADARYLGLTPGQYFGMVLAVSGVWLYWRIRKVRIEV